MSKKKHNHEEHMDESWLIPYADLLTLLLALFIVLFAISQVDQQKLQKMAQSFKIAIEGGTGVMNDPAPAPPETASDSESDWNVIQEGQAMQSAQEQLQQYIQEKGLEGQISTELTQEGLSISIRDAALFESGKAEIRPEALPIIAEVARAMVGTQGEIRVAGHTDNLPIHTAEFPSNWELSTRRAVNVVKQMAQAAPVAPKRFSATGYGEYRPKASNDTPDGQSQNRRVAIMMVRQYPSTLQAEYVKPANESKPSSTSSANGPLQTPAGGDNQGK